MCRYFRQHCTVDYGGYTKDLSAIHSDLSSIFILDNSPGAYRKFPSELAYSIWFRDDLISLEDWVCLDGAWKYMEKIKTESSEMECRGVLGFHGAHISRGGWSYLDNAGVLVVE